jgi:RNA polymerase sigma factor (sigma-70 family)
MRDDWQTRPTLIDKIKDKANEKNWEEFTHFYEPYVKGFLFRLGLKNHQVDDFSQMTFLKLWESIDRFKAMGTQGTFRAWLKTIIRNETINYFKRESMIAQKLKDYALINPKQDEKNEIDDIIEDEWDIFISNKAWENISDSISQLEKDIFLKSLKGDSTESIVKELNVKASSLYSYKKKVKDRLKHEIKRLQNIY